jgi:hypothetical protein
MSNNGKSKLAGLAPEILKTGERFGFYGLEGIGKTTLATHSPAPVMFDVNDGSSRLKVARYPFRDEPGGHVPRSLKEIYEAIDDLYDNRHAFKTLVIDTIDDLEALVYRHVLERDSGRTSMLNPKGKKFESVESYGYGKGYVVALEEWRMLCSRLDALRLKREMSIILLGHTQVKKFFNPDGEDWERYQLRVQDTPTASVAGLIKGWVDVLGFCTFEQGAGKLDERQTKAKGWSTGRRLIMLERTAAYDAKTRIPMPAEIELVADDPWRPFAEALRAGRSMDAPQLTALIENEVARLGSDDLADKVNAAIDGAKGNVATLSRYLNDLRRRSANGQANETR